VCGALDRSVELELDGGAIKVEDLIDLRIGSIPLIPTCIVVGLVAVDATWAARVHRHLRSQQPDSKVGYGLGLALGVWVRTVLIAGAGVLAVFGSLIGFALFAAGTIWRAMEHGRAAAAGFLKGLEDSSGQSNPAFAAFFGAAWVAITRGIPLALLYATLRAV
jgi:hypothetical protein